MAKEGGNTAPRKNTTLPGFRVLPSKKSKDKKESVSISRDVIELAVVESSEELKATEEENENGLEEEQEQETAPKNKKAKNYLPVGLS